MCYSVSVPETVRPYLQFRASINLLLYEISFFREEVGSLGLEQWFLFVLWCLCHVFLGQPVCVPFRSFQRRWQHPVWICPISLIKCHSEMDGSVHALRVSPQDPRFASICDRTHILKQWPVLFRLTLVIHRWFINCGPGIPATVSSLWKLSGTMSVIPASVCHTLGL